MKYLKMLENFIEKGTNNGELSNFHNTKEDYDPILETPKRNTKHVKVTYSKDNLRLEAPDIGRFLHEIRREFPKNSIVLHNGAVYAAFYYLPALLKVLKQRLGTIDADSAIPDLEGVRRFLGMGQVSVDADLATELENPVTKVLLGLKSPEEVSEITRQLKAELKRSRWIDSVWDAVEEAKASKEVVNEVERNNEFKMVENRLKETSEVSLSNGEKSLQYNAKGGEEEMPLIVRERERRLCPAGLHGAKVERIEPKHHEQWGQRILFTFSIDGKTYEDGMPIKVFSECSNTLSYKAKLRRIVEGILGRELTREEARGFDLETLVGKVCQVLVKHEKGSDGNTWARVETVMSA